MDTSTDTKRARRLAARAERQRLAEAGRQRSQQRRRLGFLLGGLLIAAVVAAGVYFLTQASFDPPPGRAVPDEGREHVAVGTPLDFKSNPPASGTHYPIWTRPGVYTEAQDKGSWVHSLEHGYVVILYNCPNDCPEITSQLRQFYESAPRSRKYGYQKLVIAPYREMSSRIAVVAWDHVDEMDTLDLDRLNRFYRAYMDKGPEDAA